MIKEVVVVRCDSCHYWLHRSGGGPVPESDAGTHFSDRREAADAAREAAWQTEADGSIRCRTCTREGNW